MAKAQDEDPLRRVERLEEELQRFKRDLLQQLPGGGLPRSVPMPSLFGSVRGGDITERMVEESKKSLFQNIEDV